MNKVSRKKAAEILNVSTRTVDRYIDEEKLSIKKEKNRIWLNMDELIKLKKKKELNEKLENIEQTVQSIDQNRVENHNQVVEAGYTGQEESKIILENPEINSHLGSGKKDFLQTVPAIEKIFFKLEERLAEKQEKVEVANFRVGQLENQLKNCLPIKEFYRIEYENKKLEETVINNTKEVNHFITSVREKIKGLKMKNKIYLMSFLLALIGVAALVLIKIL